MLNRNENSIDQNIILDELYRKYLNDLQRFMRSRVSDAAAREDIISEVFVDIVAYIRSGKDVMNERALLYRIARNTLTDYYKDKAKFLKYEHPDAEPSLDAVRSKEEHPEKAVDQAIALQAIHYQLTLIKPEYREVIELRFIEDLDLHEIAIVLNKSQVGVRVLLHRAMKALKKMVEAKR